MWKDLTMTQRASVISQAVKAGIRDLDSIRSFYDNSVGSGRRYDEGGPRVTLVDKDKVRMSSNGNFVNNEGTIIGDSVVLPEVTVKPTTPQTNDSSYYQQWLMRQADRGGRNMSSSDREAYDKMMNRVANQNEVKNFTGFDGTIYKHGNGALEQVSPEFDALTIGRQLYTDGLFNLIGKRTPKITPKTPEQFTAAQDAAIRYYESPNRKALKGVTYIEQAPSATSLDAEQQLAKRLDSYIPKVGENGLVEYKSLNAEDVVNIPEEAIEKQIQKYIDSGVTREDAIEHIRQQFGYGAMTQNGKTYLLPEKYMITNPEYMKAHDAVHRVLKFDDSFNIPGAEGLNPNEAVAMISGEIKPALGVQAKQPLTIEELNEWLKNTNNKITGRYGFSSKIKNKDKFLKWANKVAPSIALPVVVGTAAAKNYKEGGSIHISPSKRGTFTAAATKHGMGVQEFASKVLANKDNYSPAMVKKANFARNFGGHKHDLGGYLFENGGPEVTLVDRDKLRMNNSGNFVNDEGNIIGDSIVLPEITIRARDDKKHVGEYKSTFNPSGAAEFAGTVLNSPLMLADKGINKLGINGTPVQTTAQRVGETLSPTRWIGTARSGFKESPWSENNPGLWGDRNLDIMTDGFIGAALAKVPYGEVGNTIKNTAKNNAVGIVTKYSLQPNNLQSVHNAFRNSEWSNFIETKNGDYYYRLVNPITEKYAPNERYFISHTTPWREFTGAGTEYKIGTTKLYEVPTETLGRLRNTNYQGVTGNLDVTDLGKQHLRFGERASGKRDFVRVLSDKNAKSLGRSPFVIGNPDRPLTSAGLYDKFPIYDDIYMGNQTVVKGKTWKRILNDTEYNIYEQTPSGILKTIHVSAPYKPSIDLNN